MDAAHPSETVPLAHILDSARRLTKFRLLASVLLAENPLLGEHGARPGKAIDEVMKRGSGVVRYESPGAPPTYVTVKEDGTRFTTLACPDWVDERHILVERLPDDPGTFVLNQLLQAARELHEATPEIYRQADAEYILQTVAATRESPIHATLASQVMLAEVISRYPGVETSAQTAGDCSTECLNRVATEFRRLRQMGDAARFDTAVFAFFAVHPTPELLYRVGTAGLQHIMSSPHGTNRQPVPVNRIGFYLSHPESSGVPAYAAVMGAGRLLRRRGDQFLQGAKAKMSFVGFCEDSYAALLCYRSAQAVYEEILSLAETLPALWELFNWNRDEVQSYWVNAEEKRVAILVSLHYAAVPSGRGPNPMLPHDFFAYWEDAFARLGPDRTEIAIHDMIARLVCPDFLHDLMMGWLAVRCKSANERLFRRIATTLNHLETGLSTTALSGEPNYITPGFAILAELARMVGRADEARSCAAKADSHYYPRRLSEMLGRLE